MAKIHFWKMYPEDPVAPSLTLMPGVRIYLPSPVRVEIKALVPGAHHDAVSFAWLAPQPCPTASLTGLSCGPALYGLSIYIIEIPMLPASRPTTNLFIPSKHRLSAIDHNSLSKTFRIRCVWEFGILEISRRSIE